MALVSEMGAHGWTHWEVEGSANQGARTADFPEITRIQIEVIVQPRMAEALPGRLRQRFFPRFAMIAWESDVRVRRAGKFRRGVGAGTFLREGTAAEAGRAAICRMENAAKGGSVMENPVLTAGRVACWNFGPGGEVAEWLKALVC